MVVYTWIQETLHGSKKTVSKLTNKKEKTYKKSLDDGNLSFGRVEAVASGRVELVVPVVGNGHGHGRTMGYGRYGRHGCSRPH